jgi:hypothetical protein
VIRHHPPEIAVYEIAELSISSGMIARPLRSAAIRPTLMETCLSDGA